MGESKKRSPKAQAATHPHRHTAEAKGQRTLGASGRMRDAARIHRLHLMPRFEAQEACSFVPGATPILFLALT
jgi:hypothetical protein